jgi:hypothetical protein
MSERDVLQVSSLTEFFRDALQGAAASQRLSLDDHTEHYVVNVLTTFSRAEALFGDSEGRRLKPLAHFLNEAVEAPTAIERNRALQRLGDVSLFVAGFFAHGFARKIVDIDYHIAMGGRAYGSLAASSSGPPRVFGGVFAELATKFGDLVDALNEIADGARLPCEESLLRLYEVWVKTGSKRAATRLRTLGIEPIACAGLRASH